MKGKVACTRTGRECYARHKERGSRTDFGKGRARERVGMVYVKAYYIPMLRIREIRRNERR